MFLEESPKIMLFMLIFMIVLLCFFFVAVRISIWTCQAIFWTNTCMLITEL